MVVGLQRYWIPSLEDYLFFQVSGGGAEEDLFCWEAYLLTIASEGAINVNRDHSWRLE